MWLVSAMLAGKDQIASTAARWDDRATEFPKSAAATEHAGSNCNPWGPLAHAATNGLASCATIAASRISAPMVQRLIATVRLVSARIVGQGSTAAHAI